MPRTSTLTREAYDVLSICKVDSFSVELPDTPLDRNLYTEVNKALAALGGKWNRKAKAHLFDRDPRVPFEQMLMDGVIPTAEHKLSSFFATPEPLAERLANLVPRTGTERILEPSAGDGAIVRALRAVSPRAHVVAVEPDLLRAARIRGMDELHVQTFQDWLADDPEPVTAVVMNPPFTVPGDHLAYLDHVEMALDFLAEHDGGDLLAIVPAGFEARADARIVQLRERVIDLGGGFTALPPDAFKASGTSVATLLIEVEV